MIPLLSVLGWLRKAAYTAWGIFARYPLQGIILALCVALAWQTHGKREAISDRDRWQSAFTAQKAAYIAAQASAKAKAIAAKQAAEQEYRTKAHEADLRHEAQLADARGATAEYIRTHRVRAEGIGASRSGSTSPASGSNTRLPEGLPTGVVMAEADVQACGDLYAYAIAAREWALSLNQ